MRMRIFSLMATLSVGLAGCASVAPECAKLELPAQWRFAQTQENALIDHTWWRNFGSEELVSLVSAAQTQSLDIVAAEARIRQSEATARMVGAELWPNLDAQLDTRRSARLGGNVELAGNTFGVGLAASYELDLWGRLRANQDSALASLQASAFDRDAVQLTVSAAVASTWLQSVALHERTTIGQRNLASAERVLALVETRARTGTATSLEVARQQGLVATQRRALASVRQQAEDARTVLQVLLGQTQVPEPTDNRFSTLSLPAIGAGLPSELLSRRPDIARAEAQLESADANVLSARAALLPSLNLDVGLSSGSDALRQIFENPAYTLAAALTAPIFNAGRLAAGRDLAAARRDEMLANYRQNIVTAFGEVETALNAATRLDEQLAAQAEELAQAERALALAESRYRAGAETPIVLLDTQRTLYTTQDAAVQLKLARLQAAVSLYRALGGGWSRPGKIAPMVVIQRKAP
jgi:outer membrane protein, multidrug efflux system